MIDIIEPSITKLVQEAPHRDVATVDRLHTALWSVGTPLSLAIARILEYVADDLVDPGIALPALAEACATLVAGLDGKVDDRVLEAARYQIDTLTPMPDRPRIAAPDVPTDALRRR
jgi:hypothetical protein